MYQYKQMQDKGGVVIYDRGVPDNIAHARSFKLDYLPAQHAAKLYRYDPQVFIFPAWEEIYTTDDERTMSFEAAKAFGHEVKDTYKEYGYTIIEVPCVSPEERMHFIMQKIT